MAKMDQFDVHVTLDNGVDLGSWAYASGGDLDSTEYKFKPGGMQPEISLGGSLNIQNIVCRRLYDDPTDAAAPLFLSRVGKGRATVKKQLLDRDGNPSPSAPPRVWTGVLKRVSIPDADANSNDPALFEIEVSCDGTIA